MKHIKKFNEGIFNDIGRLNPNRKAADDKFDKLSDLIIEDFEKSGKDLKKVRLMNDKEKISFDSISIGEDYNLSYVFGSFHSVKRNLFSGNRSNWDRRVKINKIPFSFTIRKNELEKSFNTNRLNFSRCRVEDVIAVPNYDRNPKMGNHSLHKDKRDEYYVSSDVANKLFNYFLNEYNNQYPDLKDVRTKSSMDIADIEKGVPVSIKFITVKNKDGEDLVYQLRKGENEDNIRKKIYNMSVAEYKEFSSKKNKDIYLEYDKKSEKENIKRKESIYNDIIKPLDFDFLIQEWNKDGYEIRIYRESFQIHFITKDIKINDKLNKLPKEYGKMKLSSKNARGDSDKKFVTIVYEIE